MTLLEALNSGRRFKRPCHRHGWKSSLPGGLFTAYCSCRGTSTHSVYFTNESVEASDWIVEKTEEEFAADAARILNRLGLVIKETERAA